MAKPSQIDLVNAALVKIGQEPIVSLDNTETVSSTVTTVRNTVNIVRREMLRSNDWNCARITAKLARLTKYKGRGWAYAFQLPKDPECLRVVQISVDDGRTFIDLDAYYNNNRGPRATFFDIDETVLLCNSEQVYIKYTADIDEAKFDASLASAFVAQLAAELAYALPASVSLADYMAKIAKAKIRAARAMNAVERNINQPEGDVINIRYGEEGTLRVDMSDERE